MEKKPSIEQMLSQIQKDAAGEKSFKTPSSAKSTTETTRHRQAQTSERKSQTKEKTGTPEQEMPTGQFNPALEAELKKKATETQTAPDQRHAELMQAAISAATDIPEKYINKTRQEIIDMMGEKKWQQLLESDEGAFADTARVMEQEYVERKQAETATGEIYDISREIEEAFTDTKDEPFVSYAERSPSWQKAIAEKKQEDLEKNLWNRLDRLVEESEENNRRQQEFVKTMEEMKAIGAEVSEQEFNRLQELLEQNRQAATAQEIINERLTDLVSNLEEVEDEGIDSDRNGNSGTKAA